MIAFGLTALLASGFLSDSMQPYQGLPVLGVEVDVVEDEDPSFLRSLIGIEAGYLLSADDLQSAVKRLYSLGRFSSVGVYAERIQDVVRLRFKLRHAMRIRTVDAVGLENVDEEWFLDVDALRLGADFDETILPSIATVLKGRLAERGFPEATVRISDTTSAPSDFNRELLIEAREEKPRRIEKILFFGEPRLERALLEDLLGLRVGDRDDRVLIQMALKRLRQSLIDRGFLSAKVEEVGYEEGEAGTIVKFRITAGPRTAIFIVGNELVTDHSLWALWPGASRRMEPGRLEHFKNAILEHYQGLGFFDAQVDLYTHLDDTTGIRRHFLRVREGLPLRVGLLEIHGAVSIEETVLKEHIRSTLRAELSYNDLLKPIHVEESAVLSEGQSPWKNRVRTNEQ